MGIFKFFKEMWTENEISFIKRFHYAIVSPFFFSQGRPCTVYLLHLHHFSSHPLSFFSSLVTFVHHSPLVDFVRYNTMVYGGERNPFTGRLRRSPKSNLTRKRRSSHGLDVKTRDFLRGTVHPNIIHWMGQASLQGNMVSVYMVCHYLVQFQYQHDDQLEETIGTYDHLHVTFATVIVLNA
jgi:hypothetical protein